MTAAGPATSGIADLDRTLGGLFWGDNVVWELRRNASAEPFVSALAAVSSQAEAFAHVALEPRDSPPARGIDVIDASVDGPHGRPGELLSAVRAYASRADRTILVFDALDAMAERWGTEIARRFFARCCPMLLEIGAIAYWSIGGADALAALRDEVELLRGDAVRGYQLARRYDPSERSASTLLPLLDDAGVGLRVFLARLPARAAGEPDERHKGVEAVAVASGLVQIDLGDRRAALRAGEALVAEASSITGWRNLGEGEAMLFWILRDPLRAESS